jgi:4-hydroxy-tetrahydrodipicolinate synthase
MQIAIRGIVPPLVTPFTADGELDLPSFRSEVQYALSQGVHGLVVGGSTGEGDTLSDDEVVRLCAVAVEEAGGRVPVFGGIIRSASHEAIRLGQALAEVGVDGLQITPVRYFYTPSVESVLAYYRAIGEAVGLPMVVFNLATRARTNEEYVGRLAEIPGVAAVKQSGGDLHKLADLTLAAQGRLAVVTAVDDLLYPSFLLGADAAIAPLSPAVPDLSVQLWDACQRGDLGAARSLHERILTVWRAVHQMEVIPRIRAAIELRGRTVGPPRHPMLPVSSAVRNEIRAALVRAGLVPQDSESVGR